MGESALPLTFDLIKRLYEKYRNTDEKFVKQGSEFLVLKVNLTKKIECL